MVRSALLIALLALGCTRGIEYRDCTKGLEDVNLVVGRCSEEYGEWVEEVADRLIVQCVEDTGSKQACWNPEATGCTVRLGDDLGNATGDPPHKALVIARQDVSVSRLLCHEIPAHWRESGICPTHGPECYGKDVQAFELKCKVGVK